MEPRTRIISSRDVKKLLTMDECIPVQHEVFRQNGDGQAWNGENAWIHPDDSAVAFPLTGKLMSGGIEPSWRGMKLLSSRKGDPDTRSRMQILALFRAEDLLPVAMVESNYLGHVRTGAGAAIASQYLARRESSVIGVLGSGATARFALWAHAAAGWKPRLVHVFSRSKERRDAYVSKMAELTGYNIQALEDPEDVVKQADILITGTGSTSPAFDADWVKPGTHVNAMGQRDEVDPKLFLRGYNVGDERSIAIADGKLSVAIAAGVISEADAHAGLGEVVAGHKPGRDSADQVTIFDSSGLTIQDIAAAVHVYEKAEKQGLGAVAEFHHDDPLW